MLLVFAFLFSLFLFPLLTNGRFGDIVTDKTKDVLFRDMGQAYVFNFGIVDADAQLNIILEDTIGVNEFWVVDFQPYKKYPDKYPVDLDTGNIEAENTGECSNVFFDGPFSSILGAGHYFTDEGNFRTTNVSLTAPGENGDVRNKRLFQTYARGESYTGSDQYGQDVQRRDYAMQFKENFGYFFNCTNTDGEQIWEYSNTTDSVEFRTTVYFTNVRPRDDNDGSKGISWVTSSAELVYRIYRVAIVNFVISSSALVQPTLNFLIIKPYPPDVLEPEPAKAWLHLEFETLIESPGGELLYYINQSLNYTSRNNVATLNTVLDEADSSVGREGCEEITGRCRQTWTFYLVLDLTGPLPLDDTPIDATGTFEFKFEKHVCSDSTSNEPNTDCRVVPDIDFTISLEVTIQTVVSLLDARVDEPTIVLKSLQGANGEDLRDGASAGRRGVNHREEVTMVVGYQPDLLHADFDMLLTLFMVCKDDQTNLPGGCLDTTTSNRYVAYYHNDFKYIHTPDEGEATTYELGDIQSEWTPGADPTTQQTLSAHGFDRGNSEYTISFINTALSQERRTYTITTVYKFVYVENGRRRRELTARDQVIVNTAMVPYGDTHIRRRRDLMEAVTYPQGHTVTLDFVGCPPRSTFNPFSYNCDCPRGEAYSSIHYECQKPEMPPPFTKVPDIKPEDVLIDEAEKANESSAAPIQVSFVLSFTALVFYIFYY